MEKDVTLTLFKDGANLEITPLTGLKGVIGKKLSTVTLTGNWSWDDDNSAIVEGVTRYDARYDVTDLEDEYDFTYVTGYVADGHYVESELTLDLYKNGADYEITLPQNLEGAEGMYLGSLRLPEKWSWDNPEVALSLGNKSFLARFDVTDLEDEYDFSNVAEYDSRKHYITKSLNVKVLKNSNELDALNLPDPMEGIVGEKLSRIKLPKNWSWAEESKDVVLEESDEPLYFFAVFDTTGYEDYNFTFNEYYDHEQKKVMREVAIIVLKDGAALVPDIGTLYADEGRKLGSLQLPFAWVWHSSTDTVLQSGQHKYTARFNISDLVESYSFKNVEGYIQGAEYLERQVTVIVRGKTPVRPPASSSSQIISSSQMTSSYRRPASSSETASSSQSSSSAGTSAEIQDSADSVQSGSNSASERETSSGESSSFSLWWILLILLLVILLIVLLLIKKRKDSQE